MAQFLTVHPTHPQLRLVRRAAEILAVRGRDRLSDRLELCHWLPAGRDLDAVRRICKRCAGIDDRHHPDTCCAGTWRTSGGTRTSTTGSSGDPAPRGARDRSHSCCRRDARRAAPVSPREAPYDRRAPAVASVPARAARGAPGEPMISSMLISPGADIALPDAEAVRERYEHEIDAVIDAGAVGHRVDDGDRPVGGAGIGRAPRRPATRPHWALAQRRPNSG